MNYIVLDLEWNQATEGKIEEKKELPFEIIEIGAIKLDDNKCKIGEYSQLIKPTVYKDIHYMTTNISHIKPAELDQGALFAQAAKEFLEWCGKDYIFCTWGMLDLTELQRNMKYFKLEPIADGPIKFLDVQKLFSIQYEEEKKRRTLEYAVDFLNFKKDIPFHRALSDAHYTAKILETLSRKTESHFSYDVYVPPKNKAAEIHAVFIDYAKYISRKFKGKTFALSDKEVTDTKCYICRRNTKRKIKWFTPNGKHYYSVSYCSKHGYIKGKIRFKKTEDEGVFVIKTMKHITPSQVNEILERQERAYRHK